MIKLHFEDSAQSKPYIEGMTAEQLATVATFDQIRQIEIFSIREFLQARMDKLIGRTLDFGAGKPGTCRTPEPYKNLISGEYVPVDKGDTIPPGPYDVILCTQVAQCFDDPRIYFNGFRMMLTGREPGRLVMTYPTAWPEQNEPEVFRYTKAGMELLLTECGFEIEEHVARCALQFGANTMVLGYGVVATVKR